MTAYLTVFLALLVLATPSFADGPTYDPQIHVYEQGMESGIMKDHVRYGSLESLNRQVSEDVTNNRSYSLTDEKSKELIAPMFMDGIEPNAVEQGSWFFPRAWPWQSGDAISASNVRLNSCGGGDDAWVDYYYVPEDWFFANTLRVWATNPVSSAHIAWYGGLDGGYYCVGGYCTLSVCSTQEFNANPWSVYLFFLT